MEIADNDLKNLFDSLEHYYLLLRKRDDPFSKGKKAAYVKVMYSLRNIIEKNERECSNQKAKDENSKPIICVHYNADSYEHHCCINADMRYCSKKCAFFKAIKTYSSASQIIYKK